MRNGFAGLEGCNLLFPGWCEIERREMAPGMSKRMAYRAVQAVARFRPRVHREKAAAAMYDENGISLMQFKGKNDDGGGW